MFEEHDLEDLVIRIRNQVRHEFESVVDERFSEAIEQKCVQIPVRHRDAFMQIAVQYGYLSHTERAIGFRPESEGFDEALYDDLFLPLFPHDDNQWEN